MRITPACVRALLLALIMLAFPVSGRALQAISDGAPERADFGRSVANMLQNERFEALDALADELWRTKAKVPEGVWKLHIFYTALWGEGSRNRVDDWKERFLRVAKWRERKPGSVTAQIAEAGLWAAYAWNARGGGYSDTVSEEGWKLFAERLASARKVLEADPALKAVPGYYDCMMTVALGEGWNRREYLRLFEEAVKCAPDYETFYFKRANWHQPKWFGATENEWLSFAGEAAERTRASHGEEFYARVVWATLPRSQVTQERFRAVDWPRMRTGFDDMMRRCPDSLWNLNAFCFYAWTARDKPTARRLFEQLAGRYAPGIWGNAAAYAAAEKWAMQ